MSSMYKKRSVNKVQSSPDEEEEIDGDAEEVDDDEGEDDKNEDQGSEGDLESEVEEATNDSENSDSNSAESDIDSDGETTTAIPKRLSVTLQSLLRSVEARVSNLEAKNRELIERQESRSRVEQLADGALRQDRQVC